jgi:ectoine hydroxylase-related dioxygenase (phytanoyl-CoA dioxygenase family)/SAM-dependent methyltransferase
VHAAFKAWDRASEPLETTELRIHDGAPLKGLRQRADWYLNTLGQLFPWSTPKEGAVMMEIGSGLGYVMQAAAEKYGPQRMIGLDVAPSMIGKAKARLLRDGVTDPRLEFMLYDGVTIPLPDNSVDYLYSVAALQHIPKVYVYNLFLEFKRILSPTGFCAVHLLSCNNIREHSRSVPFAQEIGSQLRNEDTHWHHFYAFDELLTVLADGVEARQIDIVDGEVSIWASFAKTGPVFRRADLPKEAHLALIRKRTAASGGALLPAATGTVKIPAAMWQGFTVGRIARAGARRMRAAARRIQAALSAGERASAMDVGVTPATSNAQPTAASDATMHAGAASAPSAAPHPADADAWPQDSAMLPWYDQPDWTDRLERMRHERQLGDADEAMLRKWCVDGYVIVPGLVAAGLIAAFVDEIDDVWQRDDPIEGLAVSAVDLDDGHRVHVPHGELVGIDRAHRRRIKEISNWRVGQYHLFSKAARQIFDHPGIGRIASTIFARRGEPRYSLMFSKGTEQGLHQDTCVFHIFPRNFMMGIWIACEDIKPESGPLEYYPGSHRAPLFPEFTNYPQTNRRTSDPAQSKRYDDYIVDLAKSYQKHLLLIRNGDVMFWHPMLIHGGSPRLDRLATRKSFVLHNIAEGADVGGKIKGPVNW